MSYNTMTLVTRYKKSYSQKIYAHIVHERKTNMKSNFCSHAIKFIEVKVRFYQVFTIFALLYIFNLLKETL